MLLLSVDFKYICKSSSAFDCVNCMLMSCFGSWSATVSFFRLLGLTSSIRFSVELEVVRELAKGDGDLH